MTLPVMHNRRKTQNGRKLLLAAVLILFARDEACAGAAALLPVSEPFTAEQLLAAPSTSSLKPATPKKDAARSAAASPKPLKVLLQKPPARKPVRGTDMAALAPAAGLMMAEPPAALKKAVEAPVIDTPKEVPKAEEEKIAVAAPPQPLAEGKGALPARDAATYKKIFSVQAQGDWGKADRLMKSLHDNRLRGHVLEQRYTHPSYKASFKELADWLTLYGDHPGAATIYRMASARKPKDYTGDIPRPSSARVQTGLLSVLSDGSDSYTPEGKRSRNTQREVGRITRAVRSDLSDGAPSRAYKRLNADYTGRLLDDTEYDQLRALIASSYMYEGKLKKAAELANASARRSGNRAPLAGWVSGLVAWREGDYKAAAAYFEQTATSPYSSSWTSAGGAYWASRAHMRAGNMQEVSVWLRRAAQQPRTFYGLIATRSLGWDFDFNWDMPSLTAAHKDRLQSLPAGRRAIALVAAGQYHLAEQELMQIDARNDKPLREALLAYAGSRELPSFAMKLAESVPHPGGGLYDAALYPLSPWQPKKGYTVDRALIHAIIRQESRFNPWAESRSGATGLMQLMPATASYISGHRLFREAEGRHSLRDPQTNLDIGQRYVENLLHQDQISMDMFSMIMAYNAGPNKMRKWKHELSDTMDDPLLFVESIPLAETRAFVERVMANYWIYRIRLEQPTPSLDNVTGGRWAEYVRIDGGKDENPDETAMSDWGETFRLN